jgi:ELWxxDGT repeat protein
MATWRSLVLLLTLSTACGPAPEEGSLEEEQSPLSVSDQVVPRGKTCAPVPSLLADIRPGTVGSRPRELVLAGGELFFTAEDGVSGRELWKSSGSHGSGTWRVKDVRPGSATSNPRRLTAVGDKLFFTAEDGVHGRELWVSDGTTVGTTMVKDILPGGFGSAPDYLLAFEGVLYFAANDGVHGTELWRSDGTAQGTFMVEDLYPGDDVSQPGRPGSSSPRRLVQAGDVFYFVAQSGNTLHLWRSAGEPGAASVFFANANAFLFSLTAVGPELYFLVDYGDGEASLWWTKNAPARPLRFFPGLYPNELVAVGKRLFFSASEGTEDLQNTVDGEELWVSNGTVAGTVKVKDIRVGSQGSAPSGLTAMNGYVYFAADDGVRGRELWFSDGTAKGTGLVAELMPGSAGSSPQELTAIAGSLFFSAETPSRGRELWMSDGTSSGTVALAELVPGSASSTPLGFVRSGSEIFFTATHASRGEELWVLPFRSGFKCPERSFE